MRSEESGNRVIITGDGSSSIWVPALDEHYHSIHGAVTESVTVFIETWAFSSDDSTLTILEIGFGTGLNALLTALKAENAGRGIHYTAIEKYPLKSSETAELNYPGITGGESGRLFRSIHDAEWEKEVEISKLFTLLKIKTDARHLQFQGRYDIVYFDAFGADKQPSMWSDDIILGVCSMVKRGGLFLTYSSRGALKRQLTGAGFRVEHLPGPPHKREITRATRL